ncbi:MAG: leucyl/phenylalanyl-tRNA--protein transferase [Pseudomonadota bacterium]|jgi:leucyl/phenylalanyl-tRNA--protein transferase|nr:MAG: leucyl/phenylalanyl-tRNA--protein transferase [Pseudomonadota bacterium]
MTRLAWLTGDEPPDWFPPVTEALQDPPGLLAVGGDLSPERLAAAYARGIFPWYSEGEPVLWWSPDPREVLWPAEFHRSRSLAKRLKRGEFRITHDAAFAEVIAACAGPRRHAPGTWITAEMREAYIGLHRLGMAHSVECWADGELVGGLYGVKSGRVFSGESMFSRRADASKAALSWLVENCPALGIELIDCQMPSGHLRSLGSRPMPRSQFIEFLASGGRAGAAPAADGGRPPRRA